MKRAALLLLLLSSCATDPVKMATQMEADQATCQQVAPNVVKQDKQFCLTAITEDRKARANAIPTLAGQVLGGVLTAVGTLFVGGI